jgi:hypothetical protein
MPADCCECEQPLVEIDNRGKRLTGCMTCNIWWSADDEKVRLSEEGSAAGFLVAVHDCRLDSKNVIWKIDSFCWKGVR